MRDDVPAARDSAAYPYFSDRPSQGKWHGVQDDGLLPEVHLYDGSLCNRACAFCCVAGSPQGWQMSFDTAALELALSVVSPHGKIKFYGGEPTIHAENVIWAASYLRERGFLGSFRLYTNGVLAERVIQILDAVDGLDVVLNYSILHARGADALPAKALEKLLKYPEGRIFSSHAELHDTGVAPEAPDASLGAPNEQGCPHCHPVVRSDGQLHGCPFAVEIQTPHFDIGHVGDAPERLLARFKAHVQWQTDVVEAEARRRGCTACEVCKHHIHELPLPEFG